MEPLDYRFSKLENASRIGYLIAGYITNTLSVEEHEELDAFVVENDENMQLFEDMTDDAQVDEFMRWIALRNTEEKLRQTKKRLKFKKRPVIKLWQYAAAACLMILIAFYVFRMSGNEAKAPEKELAVKKDDILPGNAVAQLRLKDGQIIKLDEVSDTMINGIQIKNGEIFYSGETDTATHEVIIPRKGFFKLVLPDGTKVWLNNESSIIYPGSFTGDSREVIVSGETYFEVAKDPFKPFIVKTANRRVQAIGTAFNINTFDQTVTLTEGVIEVSDGTKQFRMAPQEQLMADGTVKIVDTSPVIAWTNNQFRFKDARLDQIMPILERWYDCRVIFDDKPADHFNATIDRSVPVSRVLELLEGTNQVHFTIKDNTIHVRE